VRTTLKLEPDAYEIASARAEHQSISLGKAVSELIMLGVREQAKSIKASKAGDAVFRSKGGVYSSKQVEAALDEE
jgi:hypothetical protein